MFSQKSLLLRYERYILLPEFSESGYLPPGLHRADLVEVQQRFGSNDTRRALLRHLDNFLELVRSVGAQKLILDGSFVTAKENPADIDVILELLPDTFDTTTREARILLESRIRFNIHFFPVREGDDEFFQHWTAFFGHDRNGVPKGLVEVLL